MSRLKLCYITSAGHSGSTLLDVLISSHSRVVSVGEVMRLEYAPRKKCSCSVKFVLLCPFWQAVNSSMIEREGCGLADLQLQSDDLEIFTHHNVVLFEAVSRVSGRQIIVDSSKNVPRLQRLIECGRFDVLPIHLVRRPQGVVYSHIKKGRPWVKYSYGYMKQMRRARRLLRDREHVSLRYEQLASDPVEVLTDIMTRLGLEFEPQQLQWAGRERHNYGGNRMRRARDSTIRPDTAWREKMPAWKKAAVGLITLPTRFS
jgi:hypothetical protein